MNRSDLHTARFRTILLTVGIAIVYTLLGKLGQVTALPPGNVTAIWSPSGFALAMILLVGRRAWAGILLGAFIINTIAFIDFSTSFTIITSLMAGLTICFGSLAQAILGAALIKHYANASDFMMSLKSFISFIIIVPIMSLISSSIGVTALFLTGFIPHELLGETWITWWIGDGVGILIFTPLILIWKEKAEFSWNGRNIFEFSILLVLIALVSVFAFGFGAKLFHLNHSYPLEFIVWPFLIYIALRHTQHAVIISILLVASIAIWQTIMGNSPFLVGGLNQTLLMLQLYLSVVTITIFLISILVRERQQVESNLHKTMNDLNMMNQDLEALVVERTKELKKATAEAQNLARIDCLTGLYNRLAFNEHASRLHDLAQRFDRPYTVAIIDIDDFKHINDTFGHHAGDEALKTLADIISESSRITDIKSRIGGEEFSIIFPDTSLEIGVQQAEKLRKALENKLIKFESYEFRITITTGIAQSNAESENFYNIMTRADDALYEGKRTGKNKVVTYQI